MLNPIEEAKFKELRDKCRELRLPPPPETHVHLKVVDKYGKEIFNDIQRAHSFTRNFYNCLYGSALSYGGGTANFGAGYLSIKTIAGTILDNRSVPVASEVIGDDTEGILIGTGDTASSLSDYVLATLINHGTSSGRMSYQESNGPAAVYNGSTKIWTFTYYRIFNNNSGASITVKEVGFQQGFNVHHCLLERTVLSPTIAVADGAQLTVTYVMTLDFSAID